MAHSSANHAARVREEYMAQQRHTYRGKKAMGAVEMYEKRPRYLVAPKYNKLTGTFSDPRSDREMMLRLGAGEIGATLAIPYFPQTPRISDPDAQGVIMIVESIQRGLNRMGCNLRTDGFLGTQSTYCLKQVSGVSWHEKSWLQIIGDVLGGIDAGFRIKPRSAQALSGYVVVGDDAPVLQYQSIGGVCTGSNDYTRALFTELQKQLNRVATVRGLRRITVDGKIGDQTVALMNQVMDPSVWEPSVLEKLFGAKGGCDAVASKAEELVPAVQQFANQLQAAPAEVRQQAPKMSKAMMPAVAPAGKSPLVWVVGAAVLGGGYWYLTKKKTKKRKR